MPCHPLGDIRIERSTRLRTNRIDILISIRAYNYLQTYTQITKTKTNQLIPFLLTVLLRLFTPFTILFATADYFQTLHASDLTLNQSLYIYKYIYIHTYIHA